MFLNMCLPLTALVYLETVSVYLVHLFALLLVIIGYYWLLLVIIGYFLLVIGRPTVVRTCGTNLSS